MNIQSLSREFTFELSFILFKEIIGSDEHIKHASSFLSIICTFPVFESQERKWDHPIEC